MNHESNRDNYRTNYGILSSILQLMELVSLIGLLFCGLLLTHGPLAMDLAQVMVYAVWFLMSVVSIHLVQRNDRWGAYSLAAATVAVTLFDMIKGHASLGGAVLGLLVMVIVIAYLRFSRSNFESESTTE